MFELLTEKYNVQIQTDLSIDRMVSLHIAEFAEKNEATQIVVGQVAQTKLELIILKESMITVF
ncbi:hypothetical protein [Bacillus sp. MRMR6]|uniref:hypothetical protein n=1 Tax=Bacillus sp. MRMR6 TaxID=1928617 RepID=UPI000951170B|nr:hypothetical protein [Bacillus sp. MRMR6]OLS40034.1 hypothetical protein BTR25_11170 [Bacillus sp. MRMR6]